MPQGQEVTFQGSIAPGVPAAYGWLRVSHRKLDPERSTPYLLLPVIPVRG